MGHTPEHELDRLVVAVDSLRARLHDPFEGWPSHIEAYLADRIADLADEALALGQALEVRPWESPTAPSFGTQKDYVGTPSPLPGGSWFWRVLPWGRLREVVHGRDSVLPTNEIDIVVYLTDDDPKRAEPVLRAVTNARIALGYVDAELVEEKSGSIWQTWRAKLKSGLSQQEVADRLVKVERGFELGFLDLKQAQVDSQESQAFATLVQSLAQQDRACVRIGSLLILKYDGQIVGRTLSQLEIRALERFPAIQRHPETLLDQLAATVYQLEIESKPVPE